MRISIPTLPNTESKSLAGFLEQAGHLVVSDFPSYIVELTPGSETVVDVPDAMFGRLAVFRIGELTPTPVNVQVSGGNLDDRKVRVSVAPADLEAVCTGILRAVDQTQQFTSPKSKADYEASTELFVNLWEAIKTDQRAFLDEQRKLNEEQNAFTAYQLNRVGVDLTKSIVDIHTSLYSETNQARDAVVDLVQHKSELLRNDVDKLSRRLFDHTTNVKQDLFADLMAYYNRPRWYQFWK